MIMSSIYTFAKVCHGRFYLKLLVQIILCSIKYKLKSIFLYNLFVIYETNFLSLVSL
jgi:hypothetical protein